MSGLFLAGCTNEVANLQGEIDAVSAAKENLVVSLNDIQAKETELQSQFDDSMAADAELTSFSDGTAVVFTNIEERKESLQSITEILETIQSEQEDLLAIEDEVLPLDKVAALSETIDELEALVDAYLPAYEGQLTTEEEMYQSLGAEDADFTTLYEGVDRLNEMSESNLESLRPLIEVLEKFDTQVSEITAQLTAQAEEE